MSPVPTSLLLLADGRFPGGGHAHSGGLEAAVADGSVADLTSFAAFVAGRLTTVGAADAWLAAAACAGVDPVALDLEADARCPSPALRLASRRLGRGLRRAAAVTWPEIPVAEHQAVVQGLVARAAGLCVADAAMLPGASFLAGSAAAIVRLLPLDTAAAMGAVLALAPVADAVAGTGAALALAPPDAVPAFSAPLLDLRAEDHARWPEHGKVRLFAS